MPNPVTAPGLRSVSRAVRRVRQEVEVADGSVADRLEPLSREALLDIALGRSGLSAALAVELQPRGPAMITAPIC